MNIRREIKTDEEEVYTINELAFETSAEANLVNVLREKAHPVISLVAEKNGKIVGHIMFSPVNTSQNVKIMGLAPMAVHPEHQRQGIGGALIRRGIEECQQQGVVAIVVLGHPQYYPRFGFVPSTQFDISCEYDVPPEVFMAMELQPAALENITGVVKYHEAFGSV
ncbi:GNAT family N-acetyltransferase [Candidatus Uabimicrobium sp. HlEnr_7]|uniref:GNAT family N-acetyltransferase n=1 Tax=Candidatus Uabimicrobium helgolandensis TaxID=3095367 RepID=UPI0035584D91